MISCNTRTARPNKSAPSVHIKTLYPYQHLKQSFNDGNNVENRLVRHMKHIIAFFSNKSNYASPYIRRSGDRNVAVFYEWKRSLGSVPSWVVSAPTLGSDFL